MDIRRYNLVLILVLLFKASICWSVGLNFPQPKSFPEEWKVNPGTPEYEKEFRVIEDSKGYKGKIYAFVKGHLMSKQVYVSGGDELDISFYAKDPEEKEVYCRIYTYSDLKTDKLRYSGSITGFSQKVGKEWTKVSGIIKLPTLVKDEEGFVKEQNPANAAVVVLASDTGAYFDYPSIVPVKLSLWRNPEGARYEAQCRKNILEEKYDEAIFNIKEANNYAETVLEKEYIRETEDILKASITTKKIDEIFLKKIDELESRGRYKQAIKEYENTLEEFEFDFIKEFCLLNVARLYQKDKDYKNSHNTFSRFFPYQI